MLTIHFRVCFIFRYELKYKWLLYKFKKMQTPLFFFKLQTWVVPVVSLLQLSH